MGVFAWLGSADWGQYRKHPVWTGVLAFPAVLALAVAGAVTAFHHPDPAAAVVPGPQATVTVEPGAPPAASGRPVTRAPVLSRPVSTDHPASSPLPTSPVGGISASPARLAPPHRVKATPGEVPGRPVVGVTSRPKDTPSPARSTATATVTASPDPSPVVTVSVSPSAAVSP